MKGYLVLSTGDVFEGNLFGKLDSSEGELVFHTGMTGYQEILTNPSYTGQIVTFTYPLIGNIGVQFNEGEEIVPTCAGLVVGELCETPSHYQSQSKLAEMAEKYGLGGITGVDTRAITQIVRDHGLVFGKLTADPSDLPKAETANGQVQQVSIRTRIHYPGSGPHVVMVDFGHRKSLLTSLLHRGCEVTVVPYDVTFEEVALLNPDGVLLSNGPGDPKDLIPQFSELKKIIEAYPTLGICLGHQLIALIYGCDTERLPYGHRGSNHPVKSLQTGKVFITSQNHGYAVNRESVSASDLVVSYVHVNDQSVEGLSHKTMPISTIQFHPEAYPGLSDTDFIFEQFILQCQAIGERAYA